MKAWLVVLLIALSVIVVGIALGGKEAPAPFEMAKKLAIAGKQISEGMKGAIFERLESGRPVTYALLYEAKGKIITIGRIEGSTMTAVHYLEDDGKFVVRKVVMTMFGPMESERVEVTEDQATKFGFKIFRTLVEAQEI